jgi:hypothetical protein
MTVGVSHVFCIEQLKQCLTFSQDDASDPQILLRLMEPAIGVKVELNCSKLQNHTISEFLSSLIDLLTSKAEDLHLEPPQAISQFCQRYLRSFFEQKSQQDGVDYFQMQVQGDEDVNDIIMKIELKKFQKLIENRI